MKLTTKKLPDSKIFLEASLDGEELQKYKEKALKNLADNLRLEGFRPGKVPRELVLKHVSDDEIKKETTSIALQSSFADIVKREKLEIINQTDLKIKKNDADGLEYSVILIVLPEIELGKYQGLNVKRNPVLVEEAEVAEAINELVKMRTTAETANRPAKEGDRVEVDFSIFCNGELVKGGKSENHPLIIGEKKFIPGFEDQIIGMIAGDKKTFSIKVPEDYSQKEISGKELEINLILKKVEQLLPPSVNDEFAKSLGDFATLKDLKNNLHQGLIVEKENKERNRLRLLILDEIVSKSKIEPPAILIEERLDALINEFDQELHSKGLELGLYLAHLKKTQDDLRKDWRPRAISQVKMSLAVKTIARKEKINVSQEEINDEFALLADHYARQGILEELQKTDPGVIRARIGDVLINEKVFGFLEKNNVLS